MELCDRCELAELVSFVGQRENAAWVRQIDADFADGGRLRPLLNELREDLGRAGDEVSISSPVASVGRLSLRRFRKDRARRAVLFTG
jgi:hypothetical protein